MNEMLDINSHRTTYLMQPVHDGNASNKKCDDRKRAVIHEMQDSRDRLNVLEVRI